MHRGCKAESLGARRVLFREAQVLSFALKENKGLVPSKILNKLRLTAKLEQDLAYRLVAAFARTSRHALLRRIQYFLTPKDFVDKEFQPRFLCVALYGFSFGSSWLIKNNLALT